MANNSPDKPVGVHTQVSVFTEVDNETKGPNFGENRLKRRMATVLEAIPCRRTLIQVSYDLDLSSCEPRATQWNTRCDAWFSTDHRVREWTTPSQVEISKWRDLLGHARVPSDALDGTVRTPLKVLLQDASHIRNNAVHRNQVFVEDIFRMLTSSIQLARMLRDQTRRKKLEDIRDHLTSEIDTRKDNEARAKAQYYAAVDDIDRRRNPIVKQLHRLDDEADNATTKLKRDSTHFDNMLQSSMTKFINELIHTGEEIARIAPNTNPAPKPQSTVKISVAATNGNSAGSQETDDGEIQVISKSDFEVATLEGRKLQKKTAQDARLGSNSQKIAFKNDHAEDLPSSIRLDSSAAKFSEVQSTPRSRNKEGSSSGGTANTSTLESRKNDSSSSGSAEGIVRSISNGSTPRASSVLSKFSDADEAIDSPSRQLVLEASMANSMCELSIDKYDILGTLDAELDNQLMRAMDDARQSEDSEQYQMDIHVKPSIEEPMPNATASGNSEEQNGTDLAHSCRDWTEPCVMVKRIPSSELKITDRSSAPSPDVNISGVDTANVDIANTDTENVSTENTTTEDQTVNLGKEEASITAVGPPVVEFGKPWRPTNIGPVSITVTKKSQDFVPRNAFSSLAIEFEPGKPSQHSANGSVSAVKTEKSQEVNTSNMHLWRKRKAVSHLGQRTTASCNSMISTQPSTLAAFGKPSLLYGTASNATITQYTTSVLRPMAFSFGDVATFAKTMGPNTMPSGSFAVAGYTSAWTFEKAQEIQALDLSRKISTLEKRRIIVGSLSFTPIEAEVVELFRGYNVTRVDYPKTVKGTRPTGYVFVDLATATQAQLAIQKLGEGAKIRRNVVTVNLAIYPWAAPCKARAAKNVQDYSRVPEAPEPVAKSEPIWMEPRSHYAEAPGRSLPDDQSSKRQKLMFDALKDIGGYAKYATH
ncbi:hypothetical protein V495_04071 [Pseudogymnoascus sp. VKM F-4514 (FW-929)]|nr:hypothetical protein V495_04071 [Pseudogymnoascus sp. VKM F-4514 (FW-929)]